MRALVLAEYGRMEVREIPSPTPTDDEALVRIAATGICGSDIHGFTGGNGRRVPGQVMGHESVGTLTAVGATGRAAGHAVGDRVTFNPVVIPAQNSHIYAGREQHDPDRYVIGVRPDIIAAFAEEVAVPVRNLVPFPGPSPIQHGALVEPFAVAVHAVRRSGVQPGESAVVIGGGPIGQSVILALQMAGVDDVVVSEVDGERRELVRALGADPIDPAGDDVAEAVRRRFGRRPRIGIDAVGSTVTLRDVFESTALGGVITLVGMHAPRLEVDAYLVSTEERTIVGSFTYSVPDFIDAARWIHQHGHVVDRLVSREVVLEHAPAAFVELADGRAPAGKVLVRLA